MRGVIQKSDKQRLREYLEENKLQAARLRTKEPEIQANACWFIKFRLPTDKDDWTTIWPTDSAPVIPFVDDPWMEYSTVLAEWFHVKNPSASFFIPWMITWKRLEQMTKGKWYVWGTLMADKVCEHCGAVYRQSYIEQWPGCDCRSRRHRVRAWVDNTLYEIPEAYRPLI